MLSYTGKKGRFFWVWEGKTFTFCCFNSSTSGSSTCGFCGFWAPFNSVALHSRKQCRQSLASSGILWKNWIGHYLSDPITVTLFFFFPSSFRKYNETQMICCKNPRLPFSHLPNIFLIQAFIESPRGTRFIIWQQNGQLIGELQFTILIFLIPRSWL